jgi:hypothetical protein
MSDSSESREERETKRLIQEAESRVHGEYDPIAVLGMEMLKAAAECRDRTKKFISIDGEPNRTEREAYLFFEHLYFFWFLGTMAAAFYLTDEKLAQTFDFLGELLPSSAVDSYFAHWPNELRSKMKQDFRDKMSTAAGEYESAIRACFSMDDKLATLFQLHINNVVHLLERESDLHKLAPVLYKCISVVTTKARFDLCAKRISEGV